MRTVRTEDGEYNALASQVQPKRLNAVFYRVRSRKYDSEDLLSIEGSMKWDGRYHKAGRWPAIYLAEEIEPCWKEIEKHVGVPITRGLYGAFEFIVRLNMVADLTDEDTMSLFDVTEDDLTGDDFAMTQKIAWALREQGFEAILTWSAANKEQKNLVIFVDRLEIESRLEASNMT